MKLEREYNLFQEQVALDNNRLLEKHRKEVGERVKYNQNHLRKFEREQEENTDLELKRFQQEQIKQYKMKKEAMKKVSDLSANVLSFSTHALCCSPGSLQRVESR